MPPCFGLGHFLNSECRAKLFQTPDPEHTNRVFNTIIMFLLGCVVLSGLIIGFFWVIWKILRTYCCKYGGFYVKVKDD